MYILPTFLPKKLVAIYSHKDIVNIKLVSILITSILINKKKNIGKNTIFFLICLRSTNKKKYLCEFHYIIIIKSQIIQNITLTNNAR